MPMPVRARALCVGVQGGCAYLWAEVDTAEILEEHRFWLAGTGEPLADNRGRYVGTFQLHWFVGHLYDMEANDGKSEG